MKKMTTMESLIIWIVAIGLMYLTSTFFVRRAVQSDISSQRSLFLGIALCFAFYGVTRILFLIGSAVDPTESTPLYNTYWSAATLVGMIGFTFLLFVLEKNPLNQRTKYIGTIAAIIVLIISIVLGTEAGGLALALSIPFLAVSILAIYLYLSIIGQGEMRKRSL